MSLNVTQRNAKEKKNKVVECYNHVIKNGFSALSVRVKKDQRRRSTVNSQILKIDVMDVETF